MGWNELVHKAKVAAGVDEDPSVADEATEELRRQAEQSEEGK